MQALLARGRAAANQALASPVASKLNEALSSPVAAARRRTSSTVGASSTLAKARAAAAAAAAAEPELTHDELVERAASLGATIKGVDQRLAHSKQTLDDALRDQTDLILMICSLVGLKSADVQKKIVTHRTGTLLALKKKSGDHGASSAKRQKKRAKEVSALEAELARLAENHRAEIETLRTQLQCKDGAGNATAAGGTDVGAARTIAESRAFLQRQLALEHRIRTDDETARRESLADLDARRKKTEARLSALRERARLDEEAIAEAIERRATTLRESAAREKDLVDVEAAGTASSADRALELQALLTAFRESQRNLATVQARVARDALELEGATKVAAEVERLQGKLADSGSTDAREQARLRVETLRGELAEAVGGADTDAIAATEASVSAEKALHDALRGEQRRAKQANSTATERLVVVDKATEQASLQLDAVQNDIDDAAARLAAAVVDKVKLAQQLAALSALEEEHSTGRDAAREAISALSEAATQSDAQHDLAVAALHEKRTRTSALAADSAVLRKTLETDRVACARQLEKLARESADQAARMKKTLIGRASVLSQMQEQAQELEISAQHGTLAERPIIQSARAQADRAPAMRKVQAGLDRDLALLERATKERRKIHVAMEALAAAAAEGRATDASDGAGGGGGGAVDDGGDGGGADGAAAAVVEEEPNEVMMHYLKQVMYRYLTFPYTDAGLQQRESLRPLIISLLEG